MANRSRTFRDKYNRKLPHPMTEHSNKNVGIAGHVCHNCGHTTSPNKMETYTTREFGNPPQFVQGPLCPNCSELPPEKIRAKKKEQEWW